MPTRSEIENAILDATGRPDTGVIKDNLGAMVDAVLQVVAPETKAASFKSEKETRIVKADETR